MRLFAFVVFAACVFGADITGTWNADVKTDAGNGNPTFVLKQSGDVPYVKLPFVPAQ